MALKVPIDMEIQWLQVLVFFTGLSIPVGVLIAAAADTARSDKESSPEE